MSAATDRSDRAWLSLAGLILLILGGLGMAAGFGVFGSSVGQQPVPTDDIRTYPEQYAWFWWAVAAALLVIALLALRWLLNQLRTPTPTTSPRRRCRRRRRPPSPRPQRPPSRRITGPRQRTRPVPIDHAKRAACECRAY